MQQAVLMFYNGDQLPLQLPSGMPPGRLEWVPYDANVTTPPREFWLDTDAYATHRLVEYREVARRAR